MKFKTIGILLFCFRPKLGDWCLPFGLISGPNRGILRITWDIVEVNKTNLFRRLLVLLMEHKPQLRVGLSDSYSVISQV